MTSTTPLSTDPPPFRDAAPSGRTRQKSDETSRRGGVATPLIAAILLALISLSPATAGPLRPPAVPLITHDPYFSIWCPADRLTDADTTHWTGKPHRLTSLVRIDDRTFRLIGKDPAAVPALEQTHLTILPTRTQVAFSGAGISLKLTFMTPTLPGDLDVLSRPVTYLSYTVQATDHQDHQVEIYFDAAHEIAVNTPEQPVTWTSPDIPGLLTLQCGATGQQILGKQGDDLRIDWGYGLISTPAQAGATLALGEPQNLRDHFVSVGTLPAASAPSRPNPNRVVGALRLVLGDVSRNPVSRWLMLAYDDEFSIRYFKHNLRPYWRRNGDDAALLLKKAAQDYTSLTNRCARFDDALMQDLRNAGGADYAALCALAYRQTFAGNKIVADADGKPLMFPKENFSNGCIGTVDVLYPQAPFFLLLSPTLTRAMLVPLLDYAASWRWKFAYAPHDLGTYPFATGQVYGGGEDTDENQMPVEETGNMLIMMAGLSRAEGNADFARRYWPLLTQWANYLVEEGFDPVNQLCTADMFGHLAHNADLSLKAIIGIGGYAQICDRLGQKAAAEKYAAIARNYAQRWQALAQDEGRTRLAFDQPGTWAMKHNLIWDRVLDLNLFPTALGDQEIAWYRKVQNAYGLPCDNRTDQSLLDWAVWCISLARHERDWQSLFEPLYRYANETPQRVALPDWFNTRDGSRVGFQARPVVGGIFMRLLTDPSARQRWNRRADHVPGTWAPIPVGLPRQTVVPTGVHAPVPWRSTLIEPPADWFLPGFDDSSWTENPGGFGMPGLPNSVVRTEWNTQDIWLRRSFELPPGALNNPVLRVYYDESPDIYLNGVLAVRLTGYTTQFRDVAINPAARATLQPGSNLIALHARQTHGGQFIDVGIVADTRLPTLRRLFNYPVRDTFVCLAPDGHYYLTGTTGHPTWWRTNEGVRVWKSSDLVTWEPLGLVWDLDRDATWQRTVKDGYRAVWAPEIHYLKGTFWITYCLNWPGGGTGLLKSTTGKAEGPYLDTHPTGPVTAEIDASLFEDDDGTVYFVYQDGKIARIKGDMSGLAEEPHLLKPANHEHVGFEGAFITKIDGRYHLVCAEFNPHSDGDTYDCMIATSDHLFGPYGDRYLAIPHAGHNMLFRGKQGQWWSTFFGNDSRAPWRERPGILPVHVDQQGHLAPQAMRRSPGTQSVP